MVVSVLIRCTYIRELMNAKGLRIYGRRVSVTELMNKKIR